MTQIIVKPAPETTGASVDTGTAENEFVSPRALQDSKYTKADNTTPLADQIPVYKDATGKELKNSTTKIIAGDAMFRKELGFPADFSGFQDNDFGVAIPLSDGWLGIKIAGVLYAFQPNTWTKVTKTFSDFAIASTTNTISSGFSLKGAGVLKGVLIKPNQSFTGGAISAYTIKAGIIGNLDKYASAFDVFQPVTSNTFQLSQNFAMEDTLIDTDIKLTAVSTGANLNAATQGTVSVYFLTSRIGL
ncbi:MAG: hypothetical protein FD136_2034 [Chitinophagaceae bacterium]|nr:MAG: hypothetical protein FD136_2034 [Chitinophagaceae bacterium]